MVAAMALLPTCRAEPASPASPTLGCPPEGWSKSDEAPHLLHSDSDSDYLDEELQSELKRSVIDSQGSWFG